MARVELSEEEYLTLLRQAGRIDSTSVRRAKATVKSSKKPKRKASGYAKKYGKAFKKVAPKYKKKNGGWKVNGFKSAQKAAHRMAKKMR